MLLQCTCPASGWLSACTLYTLHLHVVSPGMLSLRQQGRYGQHHAALLVWGFSKMHRLIAVCCRRSLWQPTTLGLCS